MFVKTLTQSLGVFAFLACAAASAEQTADGTASENISAKDVVSNNFYQLICKNCKAISRDASCAKVSEYAASYAENSNDPSEAVTLYYTDFSSETLTDGEVGATETYFAIKYPKNMTSAFADWPKSFEVSGRFTGADGGRVMSDAQSYNALKLTRTFPGGEVVHYFVKSDGVVFGYDGRSRYGDSEISFSDAVQNEPQLMPCSGPVPARVTVFGPPLDQFGLIKELEAPSDDSGVAAQLCYMYLNDILPVVFRMKRDGIPLDNAYAPIDRIESNEKLYVFLARLVQEVYSNEDRVIAYYNSGSIVDDCVNFVMR